MGKYIAFAAVFVLSVLLSISCQTRSSASSGALPANDPPKNSDAKADTQVSPVLVELFTSEGCSSCPPADRALAFLEKEQPVSGAQIIALELHVDYWDNASWKDSFSSALFSQRQNLYAERYRSEQVYTPQMIVDGAQQFIGSDTLQAANVIMEASKKTKATVTLTAGKEAGKDKLKINISGIPKAENSTVFLAIAENNLNTDIKGGENSGRKLSHSAVVRELRPIGALNGDGKAFETQADIQLKPEWKKDDVKVVIFVQENNSRRILGAGQLSLAAGK
jgi:hypothetical protein